MNRLFWWESPAEKLSKQIKELINQIKLMEIKVSELETEVTGLKSTVIKIWGEQQTKYDALVALYNAAVAQLANQTISPGAQAALDDFKARLKEFDDTIPDLNA